MRKLYYFDHNPKSTFWNEMWSIRTIEQELESCEIETAPRILLLKLLPKNAKILDAGCGLGKWVLFLTKRGYNIIGVDNNEIAIEKLKKFDSSIKVESGDILKLKYPDNSFDAYISMGVVEHFEDGPLTALKEAYRVLKPNGLIYLSTPTVNIIRKIIIQPALTIIFRVNQIFRNLKVENKKKKKRKEKVYYHFIEYRYTLKELQNFLERTNFRILKAVPHDFHDSKNHSIGLGVDFPFLKTKHSINFELNFIGKVLSRILDWSSPWLACASILCVGKSLKKSNNS